MYKYYKALLVIFLVSSVLLLVHHINVKLDVAKIPPRFLVSQVAESKVEHLNFDENNRPNILNYLTTELKYSGNQCLKINPEVEYVDLFEYYLEEKNQNEYLNSVRLDLMVYSEQKFSEVVVVIEITDFTGKTVQWENLIINPTKLNSWEHIYYSVYLNTASRKTQNKIKVFLWNLTKETFYIDDFRVAIRRSDTEPVMRETLILKEFKQDFPKEQRDLYGDMFETNDSINFYLHIRENHEFTPPYEIDFDEISQNILPAKVNVSFSYEAINLRDNVKLAIEFVNKETGNRAFYYYQLPNYNYNEMERCSFDLKIPEEYRYNGKMVSYFWNIGNNELKVNGVEYKFN